MKTGTKRLAILAALLALAGCAPDTNSAAEPAAESAEDLVDLIIDGRYIVTMDASNSIIENGAVAVDDGVIIAVRRQPHRASRSRQWAFARGNDNPARRRRRPCAHGLAQ
jgi:hypothetical protein